MKYYKKVANEFKRNYGAIAYLIKDLWKIRPSELRKREEKYIKMKSLRKKLE